MSVVAILGAGEIGGAIARALLHRGRVSAICLIDPDARIAAGKALDLAQSSPVVRSDARLESAADVAAAANAHVIVLADPVSGSRSLDESMMLVKQLGRLGCFDRAVIVCAAPDADAVMDRCIDELAPSRRRLIGSAPEALAATARALVAIEANVAASQVTLTLIGRPPRRLAIPWSEASIAGSSAAAALSPPQTAGIEARLKGLWPPGPAALGTSAALVCEAAAARSRRIFSAFVSLDRDNGTRAPVCAWPVSVGPDGIERIAAPSLSPRDRLLVDEVLE